MMEEVKWTQPDASKSKELPRKRTSEEIKADFLRFLVIAAIMPTAVEQEATLLAMTSDIETLDQKEKYKVGQSA